MDHIHCIHGLPRAIISDRDRVFTSTLWKELFLRAGTQLRMSSSYHPQTDGQTERVNQCLETFLRCFVHSCPKQWKHWLGMAQFWYNSSYHSAIAMTPFEALFGHKPSYFGLTITAVDAPMSLASWLTDRNNMSALIHHHLLRAQQRMKHQADLHRSERIFTVGDWVFLKLQPYVQQSVMTRANRKLSFKFYGPFQVLQRVGSVAYKLDLPSTSMIHPVVHVSQLKKALAPAEKVQASLPTLDSEFGPLAVPHRILERRLRQRGAKLIEQVQVEWKGTSSPAITWENLEELRHKFPAAPAWGQAGSQGGRNVTPEHSSSDSGAEGRIKSSGPSTTARPRRERRDNPRVKGKDWVQ
jgi:ribosomal protein L21E